MGRRLTDDYNGRAAKKQDVTEAASPNCPPPKGYKIVEYLDVYNGIARKGLAGTITTRVDRSNQTFIIERLMVRKERAILTQERTEYAKMIRDGYEKGCVHARRRELKNLVPRKDGVCNTLTTVQKDNLLLERKIMTVGNYTPNGAVSGRVVLPQGIAPAVMENHGTTTAVVKKKVAPGKKILTYTRGVDGKVTNRNVRDIAGIIHTKEGTCGNTAMFVAEPRIVQRKRGYNKGGEHEISPTIGASAFADNNLLLEEFEVRKLTPRECFRLMDVSDADITKIQASGVSKSQQYKLAGNSIVVSVLFHLFRKMFAEPGNDKGELELF